jgi:hypothetical protein
MLSETSIIQRLFSLIKKFKTKIDESERKKLLVMKNFLEWNKKNESKYEKIEFKDFGIPYGLGGYSIEDIEEDEEIISVSLNLIINYKVAIETEFGKLIKKIYEEEKEFQNELKNNLLDNNKELINNYKNFTIEMLILYLFMIFEKNQTESKWEPSLNMLPTTFDTPIYYNEKELGFFFFNTKGNYYTIIK